MHSQCPPAVYGTLKNPRNCGQRCHERLICCPGEYVNVLRKNELACEIYKTKAFDDVYYVNILPEEIDDQLMPSTVFAAAGGIVADPREFPHMSVLGYENTNGFIHWDCGGSLISEYFVLTAAHCLYMNLIPVKYAKIGVIDIKNTDCDCTNLFEITERIAHPYYRILFKYHDIALLKLDRKVIFRTDIRPICLPTSSQIPLKLKAIGFGEISPNGPKSDHLIKVELDYFTYFECNISFKYSFTKRFTGVDESHQFCAGPRFTMMDTCKGDSGGPIQGYHSVYFGTSIIYGITSFGRACGFTGHPAIYTAVFPYIPWIENIVWPD